MASPARFEATSGRPAELALAWLARAGDELGEHNDLRAAGINMSPSALLSQALFKWGQNRPEMRRHSGINHVRSLAPSPEGPNGLVSGICSLFGLI